MMISEEKNQELDNIKGTKKEFAKMFAEACGDMSQKRAQEVIDNFFYVLEICLTNGSKRVSFVGIGTFSIGKRAARKYRHPSEPAKIIDVPEKLTIKFKAGKNFKQRVVEVLEGQ